MLIQPCNQVCVVDAGPAGIVLSILLARQGIPVTLLEAQTDFNREFRVLAGDVKEIDLAAVQKRREHSVRFIQTVQAIMQRQIISSALHSGRLCKPPILLRLLSRFTPFQRKMAYLLAYGLHPESLKNR